MVFALLCVEKVGEPREKLRAALVSTCVDRRPRKYNPLEVYLVVVKKTHG